jgi:hypothetical protein
MSPYFFPGFGFDLPERFAAAALPPMLAMLLRSGPLNAFDLAGPPFWPPRVPRVTAAVWADETDFFLLAMLMFLPY